VVVKLRLTGTRRQCDRFVAELATAVPAGVVREVSDWYPNRGTSLLGRVYLDLALPDPAAGPTGHPGHPGDDQLDDGLDDVTGGGGEASNPPAPRPAPRAASRAGDCGRGRRPGRWAR
jgi:hypothetical protein